ncbi:MAG: ABC transporter permease [Alphaproteobacteria bacterium]|nr:ABC transporter permease [Alphaproteobacteria bacterium]
MSRHPWVLALRYLAASPGRTLVMVVGLGVALFLPAFTVVVGRLAQDRLLDRAEATPLVVGHTGNEFDLVMASLYFHGDIGDGLTYDVLDALTPYGTAVPLHLGYTAGGAPIVGTSLDYFDERGLVVAEGRHPAVLGEVVVGSQVAADAHLRPGDTLRSDQKNLYDLAGAYPLLLHVVGVLAPTGTPDDTALFCDIKTTWVLDGLLHGHETVTQRNAVAGVDDNLEASLGLFLFTEITSENLPTFHLHGDASVWPVSSVLVWPRDARAHDEVLGDLAVDEVRQAVRPVQVVRTILGIVLRIQELLASWVVLVAVSTSLFVGLVVSLSLRLRQGEITLMRRIGASRGTVVAMLGVEAVLLLVGATAVAVGLTIAGRAVLAAAVGL